MPIDLLTAFDDGLNALLMGDDVESICARQPMAGGELRPLLELAGAVRGIGGATRVPSSAQARSRAKFIARAADLRKQHEPRLRGFLLVWLKGLALAHRAATFVVAAVLVSAVGGFGALTVSANSLPGEPLYGFKRAVERTQLSLVPAGAAHAQLEQNFSQRRLDEVQRLTAAGRTASVGFGGVLQNIAGERWSVEHVLVIVDDTAEIVGTPALGLYVEIQGTSQPDGAVQAMRIEVTGIRFTGRVQATGAELWLVDDTRVRVSSLTEIMGAPAAGDYVEVQARRLADGQLLALEIKLTVAEQPTTATATQAPAATATPTPEATETVDTADTPTAAASVPSGQTEIRFAGILQAIGAESWQIGGQTVRITSKTELRGNPQIGQSVEVRALKSADGTLTAERIEVKGGEASPSSTVAPADPAATASKQDDDDYVQATEAREATHTPGADEGGGPGPSPSNTPEPGETDETTGGSDELSFEGTLEATNGNVWVINGQLFAVDDGTDIRDNPKVGDQVQVRALRQTDGTLRATRIEKDD